MKKYTPTRQEATKDFRGSSLTLRTNPSAQKLTRDIYTIIARYTYLFWPECFLLSISGFLNLQVWEDNPRLPA